VPGWALAASRYLRHWNATVVNADITEVDLGSATFDLVMLNDVMEHVMSSRHGCLWRTLSRYARDFVYLHVPTPEAQLDDRGQYIETVVPHATVVAGLAAAGFALERFEPDYDTVCGQPQGWADRWARYAGRAPTTVGCGSGRGTAKYSHMLFRKAPPATLVVSTSTRAAPTTTLQPTAPAVAEGSEFAWAALVAAVGAEPSPPAAHAPPGMSWSSYWHGWRPVAAQLRSASTRCAVAVYTVAVGSKEAVTLAAPPEGVEKRCLFLLMPANTSLLGHAAHRWTHVRVPAPPGDAHGWVRRHSRVPKILSHAFFGATPTVYVDAKRAWPGPQHSVEGLVESALARCNASLAAFSHPRFHLEPCETEPTLAEFDAIQPHQTWRLDELQAQAAAYRADASYLVAEQLGRNRMIDGSIIIRRGTRWLAAFEVEWFRAYLRGADRDQPAFAFAFNRQVIVQHAYSVDAGCNPSDPRAQVHVMRYNPALPGPAWASVAAAPWASFLCMGGSGSFCEAGTCAIADHGWAGARHAAAGLGVLVLLVLCRSLRV
jgi:hypothetical protein